MMMTLSTRVQRIKPSPTLAASARANQLKAQGKDIINLSIGEPDFDTPEHIKEAAKRAMKDGFTKYTAADGIAPLKQAVIKKLARDNHLTYDVKQITISCGVKQGLYNLMQALLNDGDEIIIPAPYWVSYTDMALLAGAKPVVIPSGFQQHYKITPEQLEQAITPKSKLILLNSPCNPSGMVYSAEELKTFAKILLRHPQIVIATDDIYESILWTKSPFVNIVNVCPELYDRTIVFNGVSKAYAMTGWRIGYAAGPAPLITAMANIQSQSTSNPTSIAQIAAQAALEGDQQCVHDMNRIYQERHHFVYNALRTLPGVKCHPSDGTFYIFPDFQSAIDKMEGVDSDLTLSELLIDKTGIVTVPGSVFGTPGCLRISFAASQELLEKAVEKLKTFFG